MERVQKYQALLKVTCSDLTVQAHLLGERGFLGSEHSLDP